jgi:benzylsuccinate CoA-transferase BbsF subunit
VLAALRSRGIAAAPCNDGADLLANGVLHGVTLARDRKGSLVKGLPYSLDGAGIAVERAAPALGEHTEEVLRTLLGFDDARLRELADAGVTSSVPAAGEV